jgi:hypothetical protein
MSRKAKAQVVEAEVVDEVPEEVALERARRAREIGNANLMPPWPPGASGNPTGSIGGRSVLQPVRARAREFFHQKMKGKTRLDRMLEASARVACRDSYKSTAERRFVAELLDEKDAGSPTAVVFISEGDGGA